MRKCILVLVIVSMANIANAQFEKLVLTLKQSIVASGEIYEETICTHRCRCSNDGVLIKTTCKEVYAAFDGEVSCVLKLDENEWAVIIRSGDIFLSYSVLGTTALKKGDKVSGGTKIGEINLENGPLSFMIVDRKGKFYSHAATVRFLQRLTGNTTASQDDVIAAP